MRQCEPLSIVQAVLEASQLGLMLGNKLGHAYLARRRDKKANDILKCQLGQPGGLANPVNGKTIQHPAASSSNGTAPSNGGQPKPISLRGVVGPIEANASGKTLRRNGNGVEYVVFKISRNGSATTVYCKETKMLPEIARRQGREAVARLSVVSDQNHQYHVLDGFAEG